MSLPQTHKLHAFIAIHTSIKTGSSYRVACGYQGIPGPALHNHLVYGELHARKVSVELLEPCSDSFHPGALPAIGRGSGKRKGYLQQIYRELATLEADGYVERVPSPSASTEKRYTLTPQGRDALAEWIAQPSEPGVLREDLLLKVRAGSLVPPEVLVEELRRRRAMYAERLEVYRAAQEHDFPEPQQLSYEQRLLYLPLLRGVMFETENVAWCDAAIDLLSGKKLI